MTKKSPKQTETPSATDMPVTAETTAAGGGTPQTTGTPETPSAGDGTSASKDVTTKPSRAAAQLTVKERIEHDGKTYEPGSVLPAGISDEVLARHRELGNI